jgi:hypothetical protein
MKRIQKGQPPACLIDFIQAQQSIEPEPVNLNYANFPQKPLLRASLTAEQFGLCGYTGAPVDDSRIPSLQASSGQAAFASHIEHIKPQHACRQELEAAGGVFGRDLCEDLSYANMIAALDVRGARAEQFGASRKGGHSIPVTPLDGECEERFRYREADGIVEGADDDADACIERLLLNHETLKRWRLKAIQTWLAPEVFETETDLRRIVLAVTVPQNGTLPEFAHVIEAVIKGYLNEANV